MEEESWEGLGGYRWGLVHQRDHDKEDYDLEGERRIHTYFGVYSAHKCTEYSTAKISEKNSSVSQIFLLTVVRRDGMRSSRVHDDKVTKGGVELISAVMAFGALGVLIF